MNAAALHSGALIGQYESQRTTELLEGGTQQQQEGQDLVQLRSGHHSSSLPFGGEGEAVKQAEQHPGNGQPIDTNRQLDFQSFETHAMEAGKPRHSLGEGYVHTKGEVEDQEAAAKVALLASSTSNGSSSRHQRKETYGFYPASSISNPGADGARQIALLQSALSKRLGPEYISTRSGPSGGGKLFYLEGWKVIDLANEVFGFNGWCSSVMKLDIDFMDELPNNRFNVGVTSVVRITLRDGTFHEDVGYGSSENSPKKSQALEKAKKEAVTDALKRAMRTFGRLLGNCVYDKKFVEKASKMRANPPQYDTGDLKRAPQSPPSRSAGTNVREQQSMSGASRPNLSASRSVPTTTPASVHHPAGYTSDQTSPSKKNPADTTNQSNTVHPLREPNQTAAAATPASKDEDVLSTSAVDLEKRRRLAAANKQKEVLLQRKKEEQDRRKDKAVEEREKREQHERKAYVQRLEEQKRLMEVELAKLHNSQPDRQTMGPPLQRPMAASRLPQAKQMLSDEGMPRAQAQSRLGTMIEARPQTAQLFGDLDDSEMLAIKDEDLKLEGTFPPSDSFSDLGDFDTAEAESMAIDFDVEEALVARDISPDENLYDDSGVCFQGEKEGLNPGKGALGNADANGYEARRYQHIQHRPQAQRDHLIPPVQHQKPEIERPRSKGRFMNPDEADDSTHTVSRPQERRERASPVATRPSWQQPTSRHAEKANYDVRAVPLASHASVQPAQMRNFAESSPNKIDMALATGFVGSARKQSAKASVSPTTSHSSVVRGKSTVHGYTTPDVKPKSNQNLAVRSSSRISVNGDSGTSPSSTLSSSPRLRDRGSTSSSVGAAAAKRGWDSADGGGKVGSSPETKKSKMNSKAGNIINSNSFSRTR